MYSISSTVQNTKINWQQNNVDLLKNQNAKGNGSKVIWFHSNFIIHDKLTRNGMKISAPYTNAAPRANPMVAGTNAHCPSVPY